MRTLGVFTSEGFHCSVIEHTDGKVEFTADADIDADGANGQNGALAAYRADNKGSEHLANGGMGIRNGKVVGIESWWTSIAIPGPDGNPLVLPNGVIPTKTAYRFPGKSVNDPSAYVDSETVPYIVVPPVIIEKTKGAVKGCRCYATNIRTGKGYSGIVADVGPRTKIGEVSIAMARELGIPSSPRTGGVSTATIRYELWPGEAGKICGAPVVLLRANGKYVV